MDVEQKLNQNLSNWIDSHLDKKTDREVDQEMVHWLNRQSPPFSPDQLPEKESVKKIKVGYLKWYYGYKNMGDELLALGVVNYLFSAYPLEKLYIEVDNVDWFLTRLKRNKKFIWDNLCKLELVPKANKNKTFFLSVLSPKTHIFLWGWEVFTPARGWFYWWWNMFILYFWKFFAKKVTLLGGISKPTTNWFNTLYKLTLPYAKDIILRDKASYTYVLSTYKRSRKPILYHDFAYDIVYCQSVSILTQKELMSKTWLHCPYLLVNTNPHIDMSILTQKLSILTKKHPQKNVVYFPCWFDDKPYFKQIALLFWKTEVDINLDDFLQTEVDKNDANYPLEVDNNLDIKQLDSVSEETADKSWQTDVDTPVYWDIQLFDWTKHDVDTIVAVCLYATMGLGVRLHFIAVLSWLGIPVDYVVYQEKVDKFLDNRGVYKKIN